jgi:hypothetical protein
MSPVRSGGGVVAGTPGMILDAVQICCGPIESAWKNYETLRDEESYEVMRD